MNEIVKINCPSCGGAASHDQRDQDFTCEFCGTRYQVKQTDHGISLAPFMKSVHELKSGIDRTGSEMTIRRLKEEIKELRDQLIPLLPEYERLKNEIENQGIPLKYRGYWWIGIIVGFILFIIAVIKDLVGLAIAGFLFFGLTILMYLMAAQKAIKVKLITKRYEELSRTVIPLRETITSKLELLKKHQESIDQY